MKLLLDFVLGVGLFGMVTSSVYTALALLAIRRFTQQKVPPAVFEPPASLLKPLHGAEPDLEAHLATFFQQAYPTYEILFCARQPDDAGLIAARKVAARFPDVPVQFLSSGEPTMPNAKILSLEKMAEAAKYDVLIISDSDVRVDSNYVRDVVAPFADTAVGAVTCLYRGVAAQGGLWSRIEAAAMSVEMSAGVLVADMLEGMKFALGPTMAIRRSCLNEIGGFLPMGDYCADDFLLGGGTGAHGGLVATCDRSRCLACGILALHAAPGALDEKHPLLAAQRPPGNSVDLQRSVWTADGPGALRPAASSLGFVGGRCTVVERWHPNAVGLCCQPQGGAGKIRGLQRPAVSGSRPARPPFLGSQLLQSQRIVAQ